MQRITATIITYNEEDRIAKAIASLSCCDEIVVIDSGSTDRTCEIASICGARVLLRQWDGYSNQKNYAAKQATYDWILSIDADEQLSGELAAALTAWKATAPSSSAVSMARRASYLGAWINHSGWYPDRKIRLYHRDRALWKGDFVHESLQVAGAVQTLPGDLLHFPYRSWTDHAHRVDRYTKLAADAARSNGRRFNPLKLVIGPVLFFFKTLFFQAGLLDGWRGVAIAYMGARYVFLREFRILR